MVGAHQGRAATCVVVNGTRPGTVGGVAIEPSANGRVRLPDSGLDHCINLPQDVGAVALRSAHPHGVLPIFSPEAVNGLKFAAALPLHLAGDSRARSSSRTG